MNTNLTVIGLGVLLGFVAYKISTRKPETKSKFSSACGCGA